MFDIDLGDNVEHEKVRPNPCCSSFLEAASGVSHNDQRVNICEELILEENGYTPHDELLPSNYLHFFDFKNKMLLHFKAIFGFCCLIFS